MAQRREIEVHRAGQIWEIEEVKVGEGIRPSWDEYSMLVAIASASRSSCRHVRAGSVIVDPITHATLATGYNGAPSQIPNCLEIGCRKEKAGLDYQDSLNSGECVGVHSEMNAVAHLSIRDDKPIMIYNTIFPCHDCAKNLLPYGLERVVFRSIYDEEDMRKVLKLLRKSKVEVARLNLSPERISDILFNLPEVDFDIFSPKEKKRVRRLLRQD